MSQIDQLLETYQGETHIEADETAVGEKPEGGDMICGDCECN